MMMNFFKQARIRFILHRHAIAHELWSRITENMPILQGMTAVEKAHLRELSTLFLYEKTFVSALALEITDSMCITIAVQACLPVLGLGMGCLSGWKDIVVYPAAFQISRDNMDAQGVVQHEERALIGESWSRGPLILSWEDVAQDSLNQQPGRNVVVHEIAHKLDMLNGSANGFPPLHYGMNSAQWTTALSAAYETLHQQVDHHHRPCLNAYAATSPAEFFAVSSEYFFTAPETLQANFAAVYQQLQSYYRQDPLRRAQQGLTNHECPTAPGKTW